MQQVMEWTAYCMYLSFFLCQLGLRQLMRIQLPLQPRSLARSRSLRLRSKIPHQQSVGMVGIALSRYAISIQTEKQCV